MTDAYGRVGLPFKMGTNNLIYVEVEIDGVKVPTYFDTGASHAYLARNFYQLLLENSKSVSQLGLSPPVVKTVQCSNGTAQKVEGRFRTQMQIGPLSLVGEIHVVPTQPIPLLLGGDVLNESGVAIDYHRKLLFAKPYQCWFQPNGSSEPLQRISSSEQMRPTQSSVITKGPKQVTFDPNLIADSQELDMSLLVQSDQVIPAESQTYVWLELKGGISPYLQEIMVDPNLDVVHDLGLVAVPSVYKAQSNRVPMLALNVTAHPIKVQKGIKLAALSAVKSTETRDTEVLSNDHQAKLEKVLKELKFEQTLLAFPREREELRRIIESNLDAFAANDSDIGKVQMVEHEIDTGDAAPVRARARFYSPVQRQAIKEQVDEYKKINIVRPSKSPWAAPVLIVKK